MTSSQSQRHDGVVAVVDDEENIRENIRFALDREGYEVLTLRNGGEAWESFQTELPDVAILDILMPRMDGLELCRRLRSRSETMGILFLTSRDDEFDRVLGLEIGADDYLCKPFSMRELVARVKVLFRRLHLGPVGSEPDEQVLAAGDLQLDLRRYRATWKGETIGLTVTEFLMLEALARRPGHVKSRQQLMEEGYQHDVYVSERTIDTHIKRIRKKFGELDSGFDGVETVHGLGYRWREG